ncbi:hypothetical protein DNTS_015536 [Danionella cerebrum]|uniref:Aromatic amino acid beta-eliminating lyase/threonine aldolase domain-containing protein n=1 Tax=Danionella cerebrum TaxID=2873325 RepID=A0A553MKD8_9TELE|nr:hypothetical protein DNTS_015536 [Danionella translucida]
MLISTQKLWSCLIEFFLPVYNLFFSLKLSSVAESFGLAVHMDGARVMNAAVALGIKPSAIIRHCHSVSVCLSKGLGAPVGSMLAGSKDFIQRATRIRKALGGGMRQTGILAAAGKIALSDMIDRLGEDHRNARHFAQALFQCEPALYGVDLSTVESNIVRFSLRENQMSPAEFCQRMASVHEEELKALGQGVQVLMFPHVGGTVRAVWHLGISDEDTRLAIQKAQFVARQHKLSRIEMEKNRKAPANMETKLMLFMKRNDCNSGKELEEATRKHSCQGQRTRRQMPVTGNDELMKSVGTPAIKPPPLLALLDRKH